MTQSVPRVTIGVPIYNGENFLRQALDTVAAQTFTDFEVLLCDNASTDGTASICREYVERDSRFRYFPSETNRGASWNYNRALDMCQSPYLIWLAHDDRWRPTLLEKCVEAMESNPEVSLVYPRSVFIDEQNQELRHFDARLHLRDPDPVKRFTQIRAPLHRTGLLQSCIRPLPCLHFASHPGSGALSGLGHDHALGDGAQRPSA